MYDACQTEVDDRIFLQYAQDQWNDFYPDSDELLITKIPKPRGFSVKISTYVDSDHDVSLVTQISHTGMLIYLNNLLIIWFS